MRKKDWLVLLAWILLAQGAGGIGSLFTFKAIPTWYAAIAKPTISPPNWIFGPVWTSLFLLMGIAAFLVWKKGGKNKAAISIFMIQLALNSLWSFIFFYSQSPKGAFIEIFFLWLAIAATIYAFSKISKSAALLLLPYIAWVSFAAYLNYAIWMLNP